MHSDSHTVRTYIIYFSNLFSHNWCKYKLFNQVSLKNEKNGNDTPIPSDNSATEKHVEHAQRFSHSRSPDDNVSCAYNFVVNFISCV